VQFLPALASANHRPYKYSLLFPEALMSTTKLILSTLLLTLSLPALADPTPTDTAQSVEAKALNYLQTLQKPDGSYRLSDREPPALTAMVLRALSQNSKEAGESPAARKAVQFLLSMQQPDGGIYKDMLANYNTAIVISGLATLKDPSLKEPIAKAVAYLKSSQWTDAIAAGRGQKVDPTSPLFGGWNYGGGGNRAGRADVSNTAIVLDCPQRRRPRQGRPRLSERAQVHFPPSEQLRNQPRPWATNDGGFVYNPGRDGEGESAAGEYTDAAGKRLVRSYGSMTYAGLKSMIYAGLSKDDPRVKAAWSWVRSNWTVDEHPGMRASGPENAQAGVFYYYNTLAKALSVYGEPTITDPQGHPHDWRIELITKLASLQKPDGSFVGTERWMEQDPIIATCLATLALQDALHDLREHPAK